MEGIIPFIFKAIAQYKEEGQISLEGMISDDPSPASYVLLPAGDSDGGYQEEANRQLRRPTFAQAEAVIACTARVVPLRSSTLRRRI
ncbi:hypothetical protein PR202_gb04226 [Eleusine coracana subsp. coracana]|uniref:Uncharacterized protein n=1 Tax=Eleusine coracana subsp. coracana TaxID=191504 RepID=A0AAV5E405_ELECO|nr:hypothetical protein QOZ80_1BG0089760 [Eleusine coracana subsp. coracana]GJN17176.1 hypothetical protein PR202_gb04226 [Eleusine coracana subsp. coracana]